MKLSKTSVQLPSDTLKWLDGWPGITRSEAIRLALERAQYFSTQMENVESLADKYQPILAPALAEFRCENFRTVARALPAIVRGYIQENEDSQTEEAGDFCKKLDALHPIERIYLLDCTVARREWPKDSSDQLAES